MGRQHGKTTLLLGLLLSILTIQAQTVDSARIYIQTANTDLTKEEYLKIRIQGRRKLFKLFLLVRKSGMTFLS